MRVLVDTHAFLWFLFDDARISDRAAGLLEDRHVDKVLSIASVWEIVIKVQLGKLALGMPLATFFSNYLERGGIDLLPLELPHLLRYGALPFVHRDPFDRMLIAQAQTLQVPVLTSDANFSAYGIETVW